MSILKIYSKEIQSYFEENGYSSLRCSVFEDKRDGEWEIIIKYNAFSKKYLVYLTRDRASRGGIFEYDNFIEAKTQFFELLEHTVKRNQHAVNNGREVPYHSPLWDK